MFDRINGDVPASVATIVLPNRATTLAILRMANLVGIRAVEKYVLQRLALQTRAVQSGFHSGFGEPWTVSLPPRR